MVQFTLCRKCLHGDVGGGTACPPQVTISGDGKCFACLGLFGDPHNLGEVDMKPYLDRVHRLPSEGFLEQDTKQVFVHIDFPPLMLFRHRIVEAYLPGAREAFVRHLQDRVKSLFRDELRDSSPTKEAVKLPTIILNPSEETGDPSLKVVFDWKIEDPELLEEQKRLYDCARGLRDGAAGPPTKKRRKGKGKKGKENSSTYSNGAVGNSVTACDFLSAEDMRSFLKKLDFSSPIGESLVDDIVSVEALKGGSGGLAPLITSVTRLSFFLYGHYNKYSRDISQSPWTFSGNNSNAVGSSVTITMAAQTGPVPGADATAAPEADSREMKQAQETGDEVVHRKTAWSVEELVLAPLRPHFRCGEMRFHAAGREDADVRMLGSGRAFVVEIKDARVRPIEMSAGTLSAGVSSSDRTSVERNVPVHGSKIPRKISFDVTVTSPTSCRWHARNIADSAEQNDEEENFAHVSVRNLQMTTQKRMQSLQEQAEAHTKVYLFVAYCGPQKVSAKTVEDLNKSYPLRLQAACHASAELLESEGPSSSLTSSASTSQSLELDQQTPFRVMHRRANLVRKKAMLGIHIKQYNAHFLEVKVHASSGTYIKEFVHGDFGRTTPSLKDLVGTDYADILQLDVAEVLD